MPRLIPLVVVFTTMTVLEDAVALFDFLLYSAGTRVKEAIRTVSGAFRASAESYLTCHQSLSCAFHPYRLKSRSLYPPLAEWFAPQYFMHALYERIFNWVCLAFIASVLGRALHHL